MGNFARVPVSFLVGTPRRLVSGDGTAPSRFSLRPIRIGLPADRQDRIAVLGLGAILAVGAVLRVLMMLAWQPAFMGFPDATAYISMASHSLWGDPTHEVGYALFLRDMHLLGGGLWPTVLLQHCFGLISAVLLWSILRRSGAPAPWALLPAAVIALDGGEMFLEHSTLSESLFIVLASSSVYFAVRGLDSADWRWIASSGAFMAIACTVRVVALPLLGGLLLWLLMCSGPGLRRRARRVAVAGVCAAAILGGYAVVQHGQTGYWGLTTPAGAWNIYSRVAPFADCNKFTPPLGTRALCEHKPPAQRTASVADYSYSASSPAVKAFGWGDGPYSATPSQDRELESFAWAAIVHQPLDYLETFAEGMAAYVHPVHVEFGNRVELAPNDEEFFHGALFDPTTLAGAAKNALPYYGLHSFHENRSLMSFLFGYESSLRVTGPLMAVLMLLSIFALFVPAGRPRQVAWLLFSMAWISLVVPPATHQWDARYTIPALGLLAGVAALGGWEVGRVAGRAAMLRSVRPRVGRLRWR